MSEDNKDIKEIKVDLKGVVKAIHTIDKTLVKQEENLKQHMYRTEIAEQRLEHIETALEPVKKHVNGMNLIIKALAVIGLLASILRSTGAI